MKESKPDCDYYNARKKKQNKVQMIKHVVRTLCIDRIDLYQKILLIYFMRRDSRQIINLLKKSLRKIVNK